jgi:hypothetical protein
VFHGGSKAKTEKHKIFIVPHRKTDRIKKTATVHFTVAAF